MSSEGPVLPSQEQLKSSRSKLLAKLPSNGLGTEAVQKHLQDDIVPGLNRSSQSSRYYGFVTGGSTPIATFADNLVTAHDQNVAIHLPNEAVVGNVEDAGLRLLCELVDLNPDDWPHKIFTTGATASNVLGLACGREYVVAEAARKADVDFKGSVAEYGIFDAMNAAGIDRVQIVGTAPHSSLLKAAAIVGLGRASFIDVGRSKGSHLFDMNALESAVSKPRTASIIAVACAEVNAGQFSTTGPEMVAIREIANKYGAWIHADAAFGLLARVLPSNSTKYTHLLSGVANIELADSITGDGHKLLNVPYDNGFFFSRHLALGQDVFHNPNAAYFTATSTSSNDRVIPSPSTLGIENSRRFRALPVYASLAAYGKAGYREILERQIELARAIASIILESDDYELLPVDTENLTNAQRIERIFMVVMFRAKDHSANETLTQRIKDTRKIYVSGTQWDGRSATRFAVANWRVDVQADLAVIKHVLAEVASP